MQTHMHSHSNINRHTHTLCKARLYETDNDAGGLGVVAIDGHSFTNGVVAQGRQYWCVVFQRSCCSASANVGRWWVQPQMVNPRGSEDELMVPTSITQMCRWHSAVHISSLMSVTTLATVVEPTENLEIDWHWKHNATNMHSWWGWRPKGHSEFTRPHQASINASSASRMWECYVFAREWNKLELFKLHFHGSDTHWRNARLTSVRCTTTSLVGWFSIHRKMSSVSSCYPER